MAATFMSSETAFYRKIAGKFSRVVEQLLLTGHSVHNDAWLAEILVVSTGNSEIIPFGCSGPRSGQKF